MIRIIRPILEMARQINRIKTKESKQILSSSGITVTPPTYGTLNDICEISLLPNTKYLIHASIDSSVSITAILIGYLIYSGGTFTRYGLSYSRSTMSGGGGAHIVNTIITGDTPVTCKLQGYGSISGTSYNLRGNITAIPIFSGGGID